ncbi:MAG: hypothetical protein JW715_12770, partial [Sedimentisphaerales bacterium]|nr:hypothetical protein [Sedimentisphaerales bacterium]
NMERSKSIISIVVGIAAILIIWTVGFYPEPPQPKAAPQQTQANIPPRQPGQIGAQTDPNRPQRIFDPNMAGREFAGRRGFSGRRQQMTDPNEIGDPNDPFVFANMNNLQMRNIIQLLTDWTGKPIIPSDEAMNVRISIYGPARLTRSKALSLIYSALRLKGFGAKHTEEAIYIQALADSRIDEVPIIGEDVPLATIENKDQIVQKFFNLDNYSPSQMGQILLPIIGDYGYLSADDATGRLLVIDTVKNLMGIALIIQQFDNAAGESMIEEIFEIHHRNPDDIIQILQTILADTGSSTTDIRMNRGQRNTQGRQGNQQQRGGMANMMGRNNRRGAATGGSATSVMVGSGRAQPVLVAESRNNWIIAKASAEDMEIIRKWIAKIDMPVPTIPADVPLSTLENKNQIVQKFFRLQNYSPANMAQVIEPLLNENGYVSAEESTRTLLVIDTVENLIQIKGIIDTFDIPEANTSVSEIFEVYNGDPAEIVQLIKLLLSTDGSGTTSRSVTGRNSYSTNTGRNTRNTRNTRSGGTTMFGAFGGTPSASSSIIGTDNAQITLIPLPQRKWIVASAPAESMKQIKEWIDKLDMKDTTSGDYDTLTVSYVDVAEVADRINEVLSQIGTQQNYTQSIFIQPLSQSRQLLVFGKQESREMVKKLVKEIDIPSGQFKTRVFPLKYADPEEIEEKINQIYSATTSSSSITSVYRSSMMRSGGYGSTTGAASLSADTVRVISYVPLRQVTVIASDDNMEKIAKQIAEWDTPIDPESIKPRIIELKNVDPAQMAELLTQLFSSSSGTGSTNARQMLSAAYGTTTSDSEKIIGPLYGQLTFADVPGTKKIIVISNIPEAYDIIEALVQELDKEEMAEVPTVVTLKFADPERLSEVLNAMFCEAGSSVEILRSASGLGEYSMDESSSSAADTSTDGYTPWWSSSGARTATDDDERPISNVIGKIRFVPETRTKSILILSPPEFIQNIEELIGKLDVPGKQVLIKAVIVEVDHQDVTSLGVQLASNPNAFGALNENAILALNAFEQLDQHGSAVFGAAGTSGTVMTNTTTADVYGLIDFLQKKVNAKILNQQSLWTEDNEEASFFKGQRVAFYTAATTGTGTSTQNFEFQRVGMNLAVRPSITPNKDVDMIINIIISQLTTDEKNSQPVRTEMETRTNMIIADGQTLMLGGILFQQDGLTKRGVPGLSDIPLVGNLFSHNKKTVVNNELLVFITPYVINDTGENTPETQKQIDDPRQKLDNIRQELGTSMDKLMKKKK